MIELNLSGYTDLPAGKVANIATFLEMKSPPPLLAVPKGDFSLIQMVPPNLDQYKAIFKAVGEEWLWFSRLTMDDLTLEKTIQNPSFEIFTMQRAGEEIGLLEIDLRDGKDMELAYFGLIESAIGTGAGRYLMDQALRRVFCHHGAERLEIHTCTMDSPQALAFYLRTGFVPYKRAIEVNDDPRLSNHIARHKGAHHPIIA